MGCALPWVYDPGRRARSTHTGPLLSHPSCWIHKKGVETETALHSLFLRIAKTLYQEERALVWQYTIRCYMYLSKGVVINALERLSVVGVLWFMVLDGLLHRLKKENLLTQGYADNLVFILSGKFCLTNSELIQRQLNKLSRNGVYVENGLTKLIFSSSPIV